MSGRLFGTDGVRGLANGLLTAELATNLGVAAAQVLGERGEFSSHKSDRPFAIVGRDPRASGEFLQSAISAGLASAGVDVFRCWHSANSGRCILNRLNWRRLRRNAFGFTQCNAR